MGGKSVDIIALERSKMKVQRGREPGIHSIEVREPVPQSYNLCHAESKQLSWHFTDGDGKEGSKEKDTVLMAVSYKQNEQDDNKTKKKSTSSTSSQKEEQVTPSPTTPTARKPRKGSQR